MCFRYNVDTCYRICLQELITTECGCAYASYHVDKPSWYSGHFCMYNYCDGETALEEARCIQRFHKNTDLNSMCTECQKPPCKSHSFTRLKSTFDYYLQLPAVEVVENLVPADHASVQDMIYIYGNLSNVPLDLVSKNFARVTIEFADVHLRKEVATGSMSISSLLSDLGGAFGFWIGFSVITFLEIIEWLIRLLISIGCKKCDQKVEPDSEVNVK